jgi:hypothetical protein
VKLHTFRPQELVNATSIVLDAGDDHLFVWDG